MFTGIIRTIGHVEETTGQGKEGLTMRVRYDAGELEGDPDRGASLAVDGVCLTVTESREGTFVADVSRETLDCTTLGRRDSGDPVNLEPSLKAGDEIGGHFVFGHVDDVVELLEVNERENYRDLRVKLPPEYRSLVARKGSVALDGISLTVNEVSGDYFTVRIVPHTLEQTTLSEVDSGNVLNLEIDMLARYVSRQMNESGKGKDELSAEKLAEYGFLDP